MIKNIRLIIAAGILVTILGLTPIVAAATESSTSGTSDSSSSSELTSTENEKNQRLVRIEAIKKKLNLKLTEAEKLHLKSKCKPAQTLVAKVNTRFGNSVTKRTQAYTELTKILTNIDTKLKAKNVDTKELETEMTELAAKVATYQTDLADYKIKLGDVKDLDCQADPTAFQSALDAARTSRDQLITDTTAIKTYVKDTIKPTLQKIRTSLESSSSDTSGTN